MTDTRPNPRRARQRQQGKRGTSVYVVLHDIHYPAAHRPTLAAALAFLEAQNVAGVVLAGDALDLACISPHTVGRGLYRPDGAFLRDLRGFDRDVLAPVEARLARGAERVFIVGNHEAWAEQLTEAQPELRGVLDIASHLRLAQRGWHVVPQGHAARLGKLTVVHGDQVRTGGQYAARKLLELYGRSVLGGHTHSPQMHSRVSPVDANERHAAWVAPIVGALNPAYLRNTPNAWLNGFTVVEVREGGDFNCYPVIVTRGQFSFAGRVYGKRAAQ